MSKASENSEWIEWAGGECPVAHDTIVEVRFRDGEEWLGGLASEAGDFCPVITPHTAQNNNWMHDGTDLDIIAYRVVRS